MSLKRLTVSDGSELAFIGTLGTFTREEPWHKGVKQV